MKPLTIVSCDAHMGAPVEVYREYLDPKYRDLLSEVVEDEKDLVWLQKAFAFLEDPERLEAVDDRSRIRTGGLMGSGDPDRHLQEMDAEGIAAAIIYPGVAQAQTPFFHTFNWPYPDDVRMAGVRAYHRWLADVTGPSKGRLIGTAEPGPTVNMADTLAELRFVADRGFRAVYVPGAVGNTALPGVADPHWEPFWAACNDLGLVLTIHVGWGQEQGGFSNLVQSCKKLGTTPELNFMDGMMQMMSLVDEDNPNSIFWLEVGPRQTIWQLIFSGMFDRYPKLKLVVAECRADWMPELKAQLDERFLRADKRPALKLKPSEYFGRNIFITPSSPRRSEVELRHEIGVSNFMFGADYPHPEGTWPNTLNWLRAIFYDVPEDELRAILGETAIDVYGLDRKMLSEVAAKIGPSPADIIGDYKVNPRMIEDWEMRSHFSKSSPAHDEKMIAGRIDKSLEDSWKFEGGEVS